MNRPGRSAGALPNLLVIGAPKCGTSSLYHYLGLHPEIAMSSVKELNFFLADDGFCPQRLTSDRRELVMYTRPHNWPRGAAWYASHFSADAPVRGESAADYSSPGHPLIAGRIASLLPDVRVIYTVREPIGRIVSHYLQKRSAGREWRSLDEALATPGGLYASQTRYRSNLDPFLDHLGRDRILILRQDHMLERRRETMREVFRFAGVDEYFWSPKMERRHNAARRPGARWALSGLLRRSPLGPPLSHLGADAKWRFERALHAGSQAPEAPPIDPGVRRRVLAELDVEVAGIEELTGWDLSGWRAGSAWL